MSCDLYKKIAIELFAALADKQNPVICLTSSHKAIDSYDSAKKLAEAFCLIDSSVTLVNARVDGVEELTKAQPKKINEKLSEIAFEKGGSARMTSLEIKTEISEIKTMAHITIVALDEIVSSAPAMMFGGCCDGVVLLECKNLSRTDNIDNALQTIQNICVKPLGFILV